MDEGRSHFITQTICLLYAMAENVDKMRKGKKESYWGKFFLRLDLFVQ
jgi:hypothetical protein